MDFQRIVLALACFTALGRAPGGFPALGAQETGEASWYGDPFHGRLTASGAVFDKTQMTAAHRTLPFGTRIRVIRLDDGRSVEVTINDRGPFLRGRILDLSEEAARRLGYHSAGVAQVRWEPLAPGPKVSPEPQPSPPPGPPPGPAPAVPPSPLAPAPPQTDRRSAQPTPTQTATPTARSAGPGLQAGAFRDAANARRRADDLRRRQFTVQLRQEGEVVRLWIPAANLAEADRLNQRLQSEGFGMALVRDQPPPGVELD